MATMSELLKNALILLERFFLTVGKSKQETEQRKIVEILLTRWIAIAYSYT